MKKYLIFLTLCAMGYFFTAFIANNQSFMFDSLFFSNGNYFAITISVILFYPILAVNYIKFTSFSKSFINVWKTVIFIMWLSVIIAGTPLRINNTYSANGLIGFGEIIGALIGLTLSSLIITYFMMFLKPLFKKLHDFANKE